MHKKNIEHKLLKYACKVMPYLLKAYLTYQCRYIVIHI